MPTVSIHQQTITPTDHRAHTAQFTNTAPKATRIPFGTSVETVWHRVLTEAEQCGQLHRLINLARNDYGPHPVLQP
ncbi:MAG: effector-associated domain EAD1-containing protein [Chloroflexota bacterium]